MTKGLVLGKFMPLHKGHLALVDFASKHCDSLTVLLCHYAEEPIAGTQRLQWLKETFSAQPKISVIELEYDPAVLTDSSEPNEAFAKAWAEKVKSILSPVDVFISSEAYGDAFAKALGAKHILFDEGRKTVPVSASLIRQKPLTYWDYLPANVRPHFVKKVALVGSESTGKSTLAEMLAQHYRTAFVPEMAREVMAHTAECTEEHLGQIAALHAKAIEQKTKDANRLLFCDTELNITKSYSRFLFGKELSVPQWIEAANRCDLYLFLQPDCPHVQDGTRLPETERSLLSESHLVQLQNATVEYVTIGGDWHSRFLRACAEVDKFIETL